MVLRCFTSLACVIALLAPVALPAKSELAERFSQRNLFHVVGQDYVSVQFVGQLSDQCVHIGEDYFSLPLDPPQAILVKLIPESAAEFEPAYVVRPQVNGGVHVWIKWGPNTEFSEVCQALSKGMLARTAIWHFGQNAPAAIPDWLQMALGEVLASHVRMAMIDQQRADALKTGPMPIEKILNAKGPYGTGLTDYELNAVWLFRFLENQSRSQEDFRRVCAAFLRGMPPVSILIKAYPGQFNDMKELELWWQTGFQATVRGRQTPFYSLEESRELIRRLAFVTFRADQGDVRGAGAELWPHREKEAFQVAISDRIRVCKLEIQKINPVYFNTLLSLGLVYDSLQQQDKQRFDATLARFVLDYASAQQLEVEIRRLLRW